VYTSVVRAGEIQGIDAATLISRNTTEAPVPDTEEDYDEQGWVEVWRNHFDGTYWVVMADKVDYENGELEGSGHGSNEPYKRMCLPISEYEAQFHAELGRDEQRWVTLARDEHIKADPGAYGLPAINPRWPQIMDDERWYAARAVYHKTRVVRNAPRSADGERWTGKAGEGAVVLARPDTPKE
jgi:hypothetical protein